MIPPTRRTPLWVWVIGAGALALVGTIVASLSAIIVWAILVATRPNGPAHEPSPAPVAPLVDPVVDPAIPTHPEPMEPVPVAPG